MNYKENKIRIKERFLHIWWYFSFILYKLRVFLVEETITKEYRGYEEGSFELRKNTI